MTKVKEYDSYRAVYDSYINNANGECTIRAVRIVKIKDGIMLRHGTIRTCKVSSRKVYEWNRTIRTNEDVAYEWWSTNGSYRIVRFVHISTIRT